MTRDEWTGEYKRLLRAYNKQFNGEQAEAYAEALQDLSILLVGEGVTACIQQVKYWPSAADIRERAVAARRGREMPKSWCGQCDGSGFVVARDDRPIEQHQAEAAQTVYLRSLKRSRVFPKPLTMDEAREWVRRNLPEFGKVPTLRRCVCRTGAVVAA